MVLPDEDAAELDGLRGRLLADLQPVGELEMVLVERITLAAWRLRRAVRLEAIVVRSEKAALAGLRGHQGTSPEADLSIALARDSNEANQLERLRRYEVSLERSLFSSIHELERQQRRRAGEETPAPMAHEINVRGEAPEIKT